MMNRKGFTLVEILIVVIILGILAAIVIPQFTEASNDARASALDSDLQTVRSQLELYKMQHIGGYPASATLSTAATSQLLNRTNQAGTIMPADGATADYPYGPYLQQFPSNPYVAGAAATTVGDIDDGTAWEYDEDDGTFQAGVTS